MDSFDFLRILSRAQFAVAFYFKRVPNRRARQPEVFSEDADECVRRRNHAEENLRRDSGT